MTDLDTLVQGTLRDRTMDPIDRAVYAVAHIEKIVTAEAGIDMGTPLPVPPEWAHKVPVEKFGPEPVKPHAHRSSITTLVEQGAEGNAGIAIFSATEDEESQRRFDRWWNRGNH